MNVARYHIEIRSTAIKDLKSIPTREISRILGKIRELENGLQGDVRKLTHFTPEYRLRVGRYRVLFEVTENKIIVYRIKHRKEVYR